MDPDTHLARGPQSGYNRCNSTTEGPDSLCQTLIVNALDGSCCIVTLSKQRSLTVSSDFCFWAPSIPDSTVGDQEGEMVAWCTKPGYGTRLIPAGALTGVQYRKTPDYAVLNGFINQELINLNPDDFGGEMDPHGQDLVCSYHILATFSHVADC